MKKYIIALLLLFLLTGSAWAGLFLYNTNPTERIYYNSSVAKDYDPVLNGYSLAQTQYTNNNYNSLNGFSHQMMDINSGLDVYPQRHIDNNQFINVSNVPEPGAVVLFMVGLIGCGILRKRFPGY